MVLKSGHIFSYFQECWAFMTVPVAVAFVAGVLWKKVNSMAAFWTLCLYFPMLPEKGLYLWNLKMSRLPGEIRVKYSRWYTGVVFRSIDMVLVYVVIYAIFW